MIIIWRRSRSWRAVRPRASPARSALAGRDAAHLLPACRELLDPGRSVRIHDYDLDRTKVRSTRDVNGGGAFDRPAPLLTPCIERPQERVPITLEALIGRHEHLDARARRDHGEHR